MSTKSSKAPKKLNKKAYEKELERLQAELVDMQQWVVETGARVVIIMEGRDAAGKGSAIKRITQYQPAHLPRRGTACTELARTGPVVLPALRGKAAYQGRNRHL